jgi:hypothetical protein
MIEESHLVAFLTGSLVATIAFAFWYSRNCYQMRIRIEKLLLREWFSGFEAGHKSSHISPKAN